MLVSLATINLIRPQAKASVDSTTAAITAEIKQQQIKAMSGDAESGSTPSPFGLHFESNRYVVFKGGSYSLSDPSNFVVDLDSNLSLTSITLPSGNLVFNRRSGEVAGFVNGSNSFVVADTQSGEQKTITVNRYGAINKN